MSNPQTKFWTSLARVVRPRSVGRMLVAIGTAVSAAALVGCAAVQNKDGGDGPLEVGTEAPELETEDHRGHSVSLTAYRPQPVLVYFYPKDGTPGCTKEACAIRDAWDRFLQAGVVVIGVSTDSRESHQAFAKKHGLPFSLVADQTRQWSEAFGVKTFLGMSRRVSFLIDGDGTIAKAYPDVDPAQHATQVLADASALP